MLVGLLLFTTGFLFGVSTIMYYIIDANKQVLTSLVPEQREQAPAVVQ